MDMGTYLCIVMEADLEGNIILEAEAYTEPTLLISLQYITIPSSGLIPFLWLKWNLFLFYERSDMYRAHMMFWCETEGWFFGKLYALVGLLSPLGDVLNRIHHTNRQLLSLRHTPKLKYISINLVSPICIIPWTKYM